jgi:6-phosphofructokinase 1
MPMAVEMLPGGPMGEGVLFETAGPREKIYFDPPDVKAAVVTCGGLCHGLNNVLRSIFLELHYRYGIREVLGIRYGFAGLDEDQAYTPVKLTPEFVGDIHNEGGTVLGSSRGPLDQAAGVASLRRLGVNMLFCIGGDGTQRGAYNLYREAQKQKYPLAIVGIPKTIDNDIQFVDRTFGYHSAVDEAKRVIACAHTEAKGAPNGIAVVKLMGRHAGFIAAAAAVASQDVNFVLVPEVPFALEGAGGLFELVKERVLRRRHAVIVIAEGAGQELLGAKEERRDASGNKLNDDIGPFMKKALADYFKGEQVPVNIKYIDPSYIIRAIPANCEDALLCDAFARNAVHAAMAGKTGMLIGYWYNVFIHIPIGTAIRVPKKMDTEAGLWRSALAATGQPVRIGAPC